MRAAVLTPWIGDGLTQATGFKPQIAIDYDVSWQDGTGQPSENLTPDPNLFVVEVEAAESVITAIEADNTYQVLFSE